MPEVDASRAPPTPEPRTRRDGDIDVVVARAGATRAVAASRNHVVASGTALAIAADMQRRIALCLAVILATTVAAPAYADGFDDFVTARRLKKSGAGLMGVGFVHLGAGMTMAFALVGMHAQCVDKSFPCDEGAGFLFFPMVGLLAVGGVLSIVGVPLFSVGARREKRLRLQALTPTPMGQLTPVPARPQ